MKKLRLRAILALLLVVALVCLVAVAIFVLPGEGTMIFVGILVSAIIAADLSPPLGMRVVGLVRLFGKMAWSLLASLLVRWLRWLPWVFQGKFNNVLLEIKGGRYGDCKRSRQAVVRMWWPKSNNTDQVAYGT